MIDLDKLNDNLVSQEELGATASSTIENAVKGLLEIKSTINKSVDAVGGGWSKLFALIEHSLNGTYEIRRVITTLKLLHARYETVTHSLKSGRAQLHEQYPDIFNKSCDYTRFQDLADISSKFAIYADTKNEVKTPDQSGELVLF